MARPSARKARHALKPARRGRGKRTDKANGKAMDAVPTIDDDPEAGPSTKTDKAHRSDSYGSYLSDLTSAAPPLLTPEEELDLGRRLRAHAHKAVDTMIKDLDEAAAILRGEGAVDKDGEPEEPFGHGRALRCIKRLNPDDLRGRALRMSLLKRLCSTEADELFEMYAEDEGKKLRDHFVKANLRLTISMARKFYNGAMPIGELVQEGNFGLMHAVLCYDYRKGFRFSTYAGWWIRHAIGRSIADKARGVRIPVHMIEFIGQITKKRAELAAKLGYEPGDEAVAAKLKVPLEKVRKAAEYARNPLSLDQPVKSDEGDGESVHNTLPAETEEPPLWATLIPGIDVEKVRLAMSRLTPIQLDVIRLRFGFESDEERTFQEIGAKYKLSRERIRQIQNSALGLLKRDKDLAPLLREMRG